MHMNWFTGLLWMKQLAALMYIYAVHRIRILLPMTNGTGIQKQQWQHGTNRLTSGAGFRSIDGGDCKMMEVETERLRLRYLRMEDAEAIYGWASDPRVTKYLTWNPHTDISHTKKVLHRWIAYYRFQDYWRWGIERLDYHALIGTIGVVGYRQKSPVISYTISEECWGKGYMTEALSAAARVLFAHGYHSLIAEAIDSNIGSNRVLQKCRFRLIGSRKDLLSSEKPEAVTINTYRLKASEGKK